MSTRDMAFDLMRHVFENPPNLTATRQIGRTHQLLVLNALALHADHEGHAYPSQNTIAKGLKIERRQVRDALDQLEKSGLIKRVSPRARGQLTRYLVLPKVTRRLLKDDAQDGRQHGRRDGRRLGRAACHEEKGRDYSPPTPQESGSVLRLVPGEGGRNKQRDSELVSACRDWLADQPGIGDVSRLSSSQVMERVVIERVVQLDLERNPPGRAPGIGLYKSKRRTLTPVVRDSFDRHGVSPDSELSGALMERVVNDAYDRHRHGAGLVTPRDSSREWHQLTGDVITPTPPPAKTKCETCQGEQVLFEQRPDGVAIVQCPDCTPALPLSRAR